LFASVGIDGFASSRNLRAILFSVSVAGVVAAAMSLITIRGELFSLALGATVGFSSILFNMSLHFGVAAALLVVVASAAGLGVVQGAFVGGLGANPILTTIAASSVIIGLGVRLSNGQAVRSSDSAGFLDADAFLGVIPPGFLILVFFTIALDILLRFTVWGRHAVLLGSSRDAGAISGISYMRHTVVLFALSSAGAGLAGAVLAAQQGQGSINILATGDFNAIAAVLVGGVVVTGGIGSPRDAVIGALFLATVENILRLTGAAFYTQDTVKGLVIVLVVAGPSAVRALRTPKTLRRSPKPHNEEAVAS